VLWQVTSETPPVRYQIPDPNGLLFSPDYKKLYVISTGKGPGDTGPGGKGDMHAFDVG
jgi:gluconolactonase